MAAGVLAGCGGGGSGNTASTGSGSAGSDSAAGSEAAADTPQETETIKMYCMNMGVASDYQNVEDAINANQCS